MTNLRTIANGAELVINSILNNANYSVPEKSDNNTLNKIVSLTGASYEILKTLIEMEPVENIQRKILKPILNNPAMSNITERLLLAKLVEYVRLIEFKINKQVIKIREDILQWILQG